MDTVSNGGFLHFSSGALISPLPGELRRQYGHCDYDIRHNFNTSYVYSASHPGAEQPVARRTA